MDAKVRQSAADAIVIGAGVSGLTAAALLADAGLRVQVLERHTVAGGCASFYQRGGYRFDVGATLVGGFGPRGVHRRIFERLGAGPKSVSVEPSMVVHLPDLDIVRYGDGRWREERRRAFGASVEPFWQRLERIADLAWDLSTRFPAIPSDAAGVIGMARALRLRHLPLATALGKTVASLVPDDAPAALRAFIDAQLLITAQADAASTDLAYGATALDLAREGTFHLPGGIGEIATALARAVRSRGSSIAYGTTVAAIEVERGRARGAILEDGTRVQAPVTVAAVPLATLARLVAAGGSALPDRGGMAAIPQRWGAFTAYVGLPPGTVAAQSALHHQLVADPKRPLGEGNTTFLSFSAPGETARAKNGGTAVTISTHTDVARWERARDDGAEAGLRERYGAMLLRALDHVVPAASARAEIIEFGTPATFERYTGRDRGLVGGIPQTPMYAVARAFSHRSGIARLRVCGDNVFPGQSTVGASLSGVTAARAAIADLGGHSTL